MYLICECEVSVKQVNDHVFIYAVKVNKQQTGIYVHDGSPASMVIDMRTNPPIVGSAQVWVNFMPNRIIVYNESNKPDLKVVNGATEEAPPGAPPMGMPHIGQFYFNKTWPNLTPEQLNSNVNCPEQVPCPLAACAALHQSDQKDWHGQPCLEYVDHDGRPIESLSFPMWPNDKNMPVKFNGDTFFFKKERMEAEQLLVSSPYNHMTSRNNMHASHLARHGHCGSPWRTNLTPTSNYCNTKLILEFENYVMRLMEECYASQSTEIDLNDNNQSVLVYRVRCCYNPKLALAWLVGQNAAESMKSVPDESDDNVKALRKLAHYLPVSEIRDIYVRNPGTAAWSLRYSQCLDLQAIMFKAGNPLQGRYFLSELKNTPFWAKEVGQFFSRNQFELGVKEKEKEVQVKRNEDMFFKLADLTQFKFEMPSNGLIPASVYYGCIPKNSPLIPVIDHGLNKVKANIDLYLDGKLTTKLPDPQQEALLAQAVLRLQITPEKKLRLMTEFFKNDPTIAIRVQVALESKEEEEDAAHSCCSYIEKEAEKILQDKNNVQGNNNIPRRSKRNIYRKPTVVKTSKPPQPVGPWLGKTKVKPSTKA